ncbi:hypothetical protein [Pedobacter sp. MC2016-24]|uniref:hypothetical protein n=1 Tax=Pedobacter sp. MC2016-24 TaxID=2780090 RepID=UPI001882589C|nr:hypothetical protein [Pedobacter sp. MC2016-24]MBE9597880.1 hypothetical protein [Pedobacter sp. MC2016-24]
MKRILYLILLLVSLTSCGHTQTNTSHEKLTGNIKNDLKLLLPTGTINADVMDGVLQEPRQIELSKKLQSAVKQNYAWFVDYMKTVPQGQPMPYHINLGVTKEEYAELMGFMDNIEVISTGTQQISIQNKDDIIHFKSDNKLSLLDSLKIDLKNNVVLFGHLKLPFGDTLNIISNKNALKSKWTGYSWILEQPKDLNPEELKDLNNLKMKQYKLTIGKLEKNGKTYMSLKGREIENGVRTVDFEIPVQF